MVKTANMIGAARAEPILMAGFESTKVWPNAVNHREQQHMSKACEPVGPWLVGVSGQRAVFRERAVAMHRDERVDHGPGPRPGQRDHCDGGQGDRTCYSHRREPYPLCPLVPSIRTFAVKVGQQVGDLSA